MIYCVAGMTVWRATADTPALLKERVIKPILECMGGRSVLAGATPHMPHASNPSTVP